MVKRWQSRNLKGNSGKWEINKKRERERKNRRIGGVEVGPAKGKRRR